MKRTVFIVGILVLLVAAFFVARRQQSPVPVRVGILHSRTGTMAMSEQPVIDATLFAIEELNRRGGVLGRPVEPIIADGGSDPDQFALAAERLIDVDKVSVIFGCWTSASRKEVGAVVEKRNHLLVYPLQYEGVEQSSAIVYMGSVPNQQIKPAVKWAMDNLGRRFFLIGSDYIFPRIANHVISDLADLLGGAVVAERYQPLGGKDFDAIAEEIAALRPAVVFNTLNGDSNIAFFAALQRHGLGSADIPVLSFSITETELQAMSEVLPKGAMAGHYASWSYFESLPGVENRSFLQRFRARYGVGRRLNDPMVSAYEGVQLWAQSVAEAASIEPIKVRHAFSRQSMNGPGGIIYIDDQSHHAWKTSRIGRSTGDGMFEIVWDSQQPVRPEPFPSFDERGHWQELVDRYYQRWDNHWAPVVEGAR
ncbi:MAG: urea ABC transporter substrate-binding protein [Desulfobulbaceae bacterium]|nr:urea ABC transporter substrate-binding protein [Desulfobulbaceae bacterium]